MLVSFAPALSAQVVHDVASGATTTVSTVIDATNTAGLLKTGEGRLIVSNVGNTYTGNTVISAGILQANTTTNTNGTPLGAASSAGANIVTVQNGATLQLNKNSRVASKELHLQGVGFSDGAGGTYGAFYADASGTTGNNTRWGIGGGLTTAVALDGNATVRIDGTAIGSATSSGVLFGGTNLNGFTLTKTGGGRLNFDTQNTGLTGTGTVVVAQGVLGFRVGAFDANRALVIDAGAEGRITADTGAINGAVVTVNGTLELNGRGNGTAGSDTAAYTQFIEGLSGLGVVTTGSFGNTGAQTLQLGSATVDSSFAGTITQANGSIALQKVRANAVTLSGTNSYTGGTSLVGGTLVLGSTGAIGSTGNIVFATDTLTQQTGGTLKFSSANTTDYSARIVNSTAPVALNTGGLNVTFASALSATNTGGLIKTGAGTLTLSGNNAYSGTTVVEAGRLVINGVSTAANGAVTVASGATLAGQGTVGGLTTLSSGANLAVGDGAAAAVGVTTFANGLTLTGGSTLTFQLGTAGNDLITLTGGALTYAGTGPVVIDVVAAGTLGQNTFNLFNLTGAASNGLGDIAGIFTTSGTSPALDYRFVVNGSALQLITASSAIPEPSTWALLAGFAGLTAACVRRRAHRVA